VIVVDASALVDLLLDAPGADVLEQRLRTEDLHAPHLVDVEVLSTLRGLVLGGKLGATRAEEALTDLDDLPLERWPSTGALRRRAFELRGNLSAHDATYLVLAEALDCPLLTRDARLARAPGSAVRVEVV
jgi:predicted nucleic acid-binding protein